MNAITLTVADESTVEGTATYRQAAGARGERGPVGDTGPLYDTAQPVAATVSDRDEVGLVVAILVALDDGTVAEWAISRDSAGRAVNIHPVGG